MQLYFALNAGATSIIEVKFLAFQFQLGGISLKRLPRDLISRISSDSALHLPPAGIKVTLHFVVAKGCRNRDPHTEPHHNTHASACSIATATLGPGR